MSSSLSATPRSLRILHLTDTHLFGDGSKHYDTVDTTDHLRRALAHVDEQEFDLVVCAGDVSEDGSVASYEIARNVIGSWAEARGARAIFAMGNHDRRVSFRTVLGAGQPGATAREFAGPSDAGTAATGGSDPAPIASVATLDRWRTIVLDTSVPRAGYGALEPEQLSFLREALSKQVGNDLLGTVLVMHHPPIDAQTDLLQALALGEADTAALWDVVRGSDVRVILSGHYHLPIVETINGIPVVVAPGVANIARAFESPDEESASDGFGGAVIEVTDRGVRVVPFERPVTDEEIFRFPRDTVQKIIDVAGQRAA